MYCAGEESSSSTVQSCINQRISSRCWGSPGMAPHHEASYSEEQIGAAAKAYYYYSLAASNNDNANANTNANATSLHSPNNLVKTETVIPSYSPFIMGGSEMLVQPPKMARPSSMVPQEEDLIGRLDECVSDANSANSSAVDCTLSLSTPSTRFRNSSSSSSSPTCSSPSSSPAALPFYAWNNGLWLQQQQQGPVSEAARGSMLQYMGVNKQGPCYVGLGIRNNAATAPNIFSHNMMGVSGRKQGGGGPRGGSDASAPRKCANCDTTTTPLWRNGPKGPKSLCNACGIRFKKEERRITATVVQQQSPDRPKPAEDGDGRNMDRAKAERERENSNSCLTWQSSSSSSSCCAGAVAQGRLGIGLGTAMVDCSFNAHTESSCRSGTELAAAAGGGCEGSASAAGVGVGGPAQTTQPLLVLGLSVHGK